MKCDLWAKEGQSLDAGRLSVSWYLSIMHKREWKYHTDWLMCLYRQDFNASALRISSICISMTADAKTARGNIRLLFLWTGKTLIISLCTSLFTSNDHTHPPHAPTSQTPIDPCGTDYARAHDRRIRPVHCNERDQSIHFKLVLTLPWYKAQNTLAFILINR